jgi:hypothetical protein
MTEQDEGIMTFFEAEAHSFVVRLWREHQDEAAAPAEWRGWIDHVQSGQRHYFREITDLSRIVARYVNVAVDLEDQLFMPMQAKDQQA